MTGGDRVLEREVLQLFAMQARMLLGRMQDATPAEIGAFAHTLCGSARGIGAWRVAEAAEVLERTAAEGCDIAAGRERLVPRHRRGERGNRRACAVGRRSGSFVGSRSRKYWRGHA